MIFQQCFLLIAAVQLNPLCVVDMAAVVTDSHFPYLNQTEADWFMSVQRLKSLLIDFH